MANPAGGWDCVVIGAGPGGAATALGLARRGVRVLLVDKTTFPRPKVCGCCLNPRSLAALERLGLGGLVEETGAVRLKAIRIASRGRQAIVRRELGVSLSREVLDAAIVKAAIESGAEFWDGTRVVAVSRGAVGEDRHRVSLEGPAGVCSVGARVVVVASGLVDVIEERKVETWCAEDSKIGAGAWVERAPEGYELGRIEMACGAEGYVGAVVLEDGRLDLAAALCPESVRRAGGIGRLAGAIVARAGLPEIAGIGELSWRGTPRLTRRVASVAEAGRFRVGDAAGYVEPFTGEGIGWALAGALELAPIMAHGLADPGYDAEAAWARVYAQSIRARQRLCWAVAVVLRRPWMTRLIVGALGLAPELASPVLRRMHEKQACEEEAGERVTMGGEVFCRP